MIVELSLSELDITIPRCSLCPRLVAWREEVARVKRASFADQDYWGKAVPNFGDHQATGLIVGLAPAAHGANRTGRMFTGDRSGDWLFRALHNAGLANQASSVDALDGLVLNKVLITACCHCAPPDNKPTLVELNTCGRYLVDTVQARPWKAYLCLGSIAFERLHRTLGVRAPKFGHGVESILPGGEMVFASYHPSQQNTFTGKLTEAMLDDVVGRFSRLL